MCSRCGIIRSRLWLRGQHQYRTALDRPDDHFILTVLGYLLCVVSFFWKHQSVLTDIHFMVKTGWEMCQVHCCEEYTLHLVDVSRIASYVSILYLVELEVDYQLL